MNSTSAAQNARRKLRTLGILIVMLAGASGAFSQSEPSSSGQAKEITELEQRRAAVVVHRDIDFLDKITAPDSVRILPTGILETKSQLLSDLKSGVLIYSSIDVDELSVNIYGNTAVVAGRSAFQGQRDGKPFKGRCRFSRAWVNKDTVGRKCCFN